MSKQGLPPWHLWGNSQATQLVSNGTTITQSQSQLIRINYARPETWRFVFATTIIDGNTAAGGTLLVDYAITIGVGRASFTLSPCPRFQFSWVAAAPIGQSLFCSAPDGPAKDSAFPNRPNVIETLSAQDLQVTALLTFGTGTPGETIKANVQAFFSPETHIRPEWLLRQFPGDEHTGT